MRKVDFLTHVFPEMEWIEPAEPGVFKYGLKFLRTPIRRRVRLTGKAPTGGYAMGWEEVSAQQHRGAVRFHPDSDYSHTLTIQLDYAAEHFPIDKPRLHEALHGGLERIRAFLKTRPTHRIRASRAIHSWTLDP